MLGKNKADHANIIAVDCRQDIWDTAFVRDAQNIVSTGMREVLEKDAIGSGGCGADER